MDQVERRVVWSGVVEGRRGEEVKAGGSSLLEKELQN